MDTQFDSPQGGRLDTVRFLFPYRLQGGAGFSYARMQVC